ncbi:MAG: 16S rRNA processing protein RimM [Magnetococcales bacterium]|nr:16S rRNA processing protein RimM [Magnetococcales bacterium]
MANHDVRWLTLGRLVGSFGVHGEVRVQTFTETPERLLEFPVWSLDLPRGSSSPGGAAQKVSAQKVSVISGRRHGNDTVVVRLTDVTTREEAQLLSGAWVRVERTEVTEPEEGAYYWTDLEGCRVVTDGGEVLGQVQSMLATGANDVMILITPSQTERLLPFTREVVETVDLQQRIITVRLMAGM